MKKKYYILMLLIGVLSIGSIVKVNAQTYECQVIEDEFGYIVYQMKETSGTNMPTTSTVINDITFVIKYPTGPQTMALICDPNDYKIEFTLGGEQSFDGFDYFYWNANAGSGFSPPNNWVLDEWEDICKFKASGDPGSGLFQVAINGWDGRGLNWNQTIGTVATDFLPTIIGGGVTSSYTTIVYDFVWTGATDTEWDKTANWSTECGTAISAAPNTGNNCILPSGLANYPNTVNLAQFGGHQPACSDLKIVSGASLSLDEKDVTTLDLTWTFANLTVDGVITSIPNTRLTVTGSTTINSAEGVIVQADATGVGSFIDNGITYGGSGTAKVQTYLTGSGSVDVFDFHCVGPTVDITGTGVTLSAFNVVNEHTYAYKYNEPTDGWVNYTGLTDPVPTAKGIGLSTNDGSTNTMEMTGELKTGAIISEAMTVDLNGTYLLSNPYPSSIFWDDLYGNNGNVNDQVYVYDGTNYQGYNISSGGAGTFQGYIQVGQGFFVDATSATTFAFANGDRHHSADPFYKSKTFTNRLKVNVSGNESTDGLLVHFYEGALSGYEPNEDIKKKMSFSDYATQLWTVLEDGQKMSINALPTTLLGKGMQSIPMSFICTATGEYTMSLLDAETFEIGTEIWLEDKQTGAEWISVNDSPDYTFTASADDLEDRFVLHFFGPTGVDEFEIGNTVDIFSYRQSAFVRNNTNEIIKEVNIYTLAGELLQSNKPSDLKLTKFWVSDNMGYYVVRVITDKNVYTEKVFISK